MLIDPLGHEVRYSIAGHPPPFLRCQDGTVRQLTALILLYTDGLVERRREVIDIGLARLMAAAATIDFTKVDGCEELIETALAGALQHDDIAVISAQLVVPHPRFQYEMDASIELLGQSRHAVRTWLRSLGMEADELSDVVLAIGEATSNAVLHAVASDTEQVSITIEHRPGRAIEAVISNRGSWLHRSERERSGGGRGLGIMRALMGNVDIATDEHGTTVRMHRQLLPGSSR